MDAQPHPYHRAFCRKNFGIFHYLVHYMNTYSLAAIPLAAFLAFSACSDNPSPTQPAPSEHLTDTTVHAVVAKWYDNHAAAITLTYDSGWPAYKTDNKVQMYARGYGIKIDYEIVTSTYRMYPELQDYLKNVIIPLGIGVFGHGDVHVGHYSMTYEQAYASFRRCYETMIDFGLTPISYAYPGGLAFEEETWRAVADAGFLSARSFYKEAYLDPYITPDTVIEPPNWYNLPTLVMEEYHIANCEMCVGSSQELGRYLDETVKRTAWLMPTYHIIYDTDDNIGFYRLSEFNKDLQEIKKRDLWSATFNEATLYVYERARAGVQAKWKVNEKSEVQSMTINVTDNLNNEKFNQPLTILVDIPASWVGRPLEIYDGKTLVECVIFPSEHAKFSLRPIDREYRIRPLPPEWH